MRKIGCTAILLLLFLLARTQDVIWSMPATDGDWLFKQYENATTDTGRVKGLLRLSWFYVRKQGDEKSDLDSALQLARRADTISRRINYTWGVQEAAYWMTKAWGDEKNFAAPYQLLDQLNDTTRIKVLLAMADTYVRWGNARSPILDTALNLAHQALALSTSIHSVQWTLASRLRMATYYYAEHSVVPGKEVFSHLVDSCWKGHYWETLRDCHYWLTICVGVDTSLLSFAAAFQDRLFHDYLQEKDTSIIMAMRPVIVDWVKRDATLCYMVKEFQRSEQQFYRVIEFQRSFPAIDYSVYRFSVQLMYRGKSDEALRICLESIKLVERDGNKERISDPYWNTGYVYYKLRREDDGMSYYKKAVALDQERGALISTENLRMVAGIYVERKQPETALRILQENLDRASVHHLYPNKERSWILAGLANCYDEMGQFQKAEKFYLESIEAATAAKSSVDFLGNGYFLSQLYIKNHQFEKARPYLERMETDSLRVFQPLDRLQQVQRYLFTIDSVKGDYLAAIKHQRQYVILGDSIHSLARSRQLEEVKAKYETEKKDQDLLLKDKDLESTRRSRNFAIFSVIMLAALVVLLYSRFRVKQKSTVLLRSQQVVIQESNLELQQLNERQKRLLSEKEWLVKEIHHRVKNNLQIIISLLNTQSKFLDSQEAVDAIRESRGRMQAMSLIHQKLYQHENNAVVDMPTYIQELVDQLEKGVNTRQKILFDLEVDPIGLDISQAIPVGLVLNEAITNAIKYAFAGRAGGTVRVALKQLDEDIRLEIADDGVGLPEGFQLKEARSMGLRLIQGLVKQLDGKLQMNKESGLTFEIRFRADSQLLDLSNNETYKGAGQLA